MYKRISITSLIWLYLCIALTAQIPANYYNSAIGKQNAELKTALFRIIQPHTMLEYYSLSNSFRSTDWHPNGYFWDMYSDNKRTSWSSGLNREHNMPKSWFGISSDEVNSAPIATDLHNLYPSDVDANSKKSNFALGIVGAISYQNGVVKVGSNVYPGYSGDVFEPANEYKGDFARDYMYMVTCYEDYSNVWQSTGTISMLQRNTFPVFNAYAVKLLMKWHRNDPVSTKEINRNNAVYILQNNRNPFIDHPVLAEYIWGKYMGDIWDGTNDLPETSNPLIYKYDAANNSIFVKLNKPSKAIYKIFSLTGTLIQNGKMDSSSLITLKNQNTNENYEKGVYILSVYAGGRRKTIRLLVF
ncbi:MAG: endonuclease [Paludibacter sp.]